VRIRARVRDRAEAAVVAMVMARKHEKAVTRRLLVAERATLRGVRMAARGIIDSVVSSIAGLPDTEHAATAMRTKVRHAIPHLTSAIADAVAVGRSKARDGAFADIEEVVDEEVETPDATSDDASYAYTVAASLAAWWGGAAIRKADEALRDERSAAAAVRATIVAFEPRIRRAAATETASAFNGERSAAIEVVAAGLEEGGPYRAAGRLLTAEDEAPQLVKVWSAMLDAKVCPECAAMAGTVVQIGEDFLGGDPPMHPWCRCVPLIMPIYTSIADARAMWREAA
jgi:hypothetical protein